MEYLFVFIVGSVIGSFLNVCIYRVPNKISIITPNSFCPNCGAHIPFYYNIPIISYFMLKGRCHNCHQSISARYPVVEFGSGVLTLLTFLKFGLTPAFFFYGVLVYFLIVISFIDLSTNLIYNRFLIYLFVFGVVFNLVFPVRPWVSALTGVVAGGASLLFFALLGQVIFRKESMGLGDVKFGAVLGFFLGWKMILLALLIGFVYAMVAMVFYSLIQGKRVAGYVPMAPFLAVGSLTFVYWGPALIAWYWQFFLPVQM